LRIWVFVGIALVFLAMAAIRPVIDFVGMRTRLVVAQQSLLSYRFAVLSYCAQVGTVPEDLFQTVSEEESEATAEEAPPAPEEAPAKPRGHSLGDELIASKKVEKISFPLGKKYTLPEGYGPLVAARPEIWAVSLPALERLFQKNRLFPSSRSSKVAVLVVPFLSEKEAKGVQNMVSTIREQDSAGAMTFVGDCFFTPSPVEGKFTGWLYLSDL